MEGLRPRLTRFEQKSQIKDEIAHAARCDWPQIEPNLGKSCSIHESPRALMSRTRIGPFSIGPRRLAHLCTNGFPRLEHLK